MRIPFTSSLVRLPRLLVGLLLYGFADALMIRAGVGVDPWTVFAQGLVNVTGLPIGLVINLSGLLVLLLWIPLRQRPGIGTVLNVLLVGPFIELGLWVLPTPSALWPSALWVQIGFFTTGLLLLAVASGIYIGAQLGPGARDGLMTGLHSRLNWPIFAGRAAVEGTVLLAGWLLGGDVGFGTLAFAVLIGPLCGVTLRWFGVTPRRVSGRSDAVRELTLVEEGEQVALYESARADRAVAGGVGREDEVRRGPQR